PCVSLTLHPFPTRRSSDLGRVLTVVVSSTAATPLESILVPVTDAAREHPARVIILQEADGPSDEPRLDAQIHLGGKAGASEIIVDRKSTRLNSSHVSISYA